MRFVGKTALIVGGTSGIGAATSRLFAQEGARVYLTGRREETGTQVVETIREEGGEAHFIQADIRNSADCARMVDVAAEATGRLDIAFNNSGILHPHVRVADLEEDVWNDVIAVDLNGYFLAMKYELRAMLLNRSGIIVNMASVNGLMGAAYGSAYAAAKHGVIGLTRSAALEYISEGIRINAICPGGVETDLVTSLTVDPEVKRGIEAMHPIDRMARPEEIARAVLSLSSDDMSFMVGQAVGLDGGMTAGFPVHSRPVVE